MVVRVRCIRPRIIFRLWPRYMSIVLSHTLLGGGHPSFPMLIDSWLHACRAALVSAADFASVGFSKQRYYTSVLFSL